MSKTRTTGWRHLILIAIAFVLTTIYAGSARADIGDRYNVNVKGTFHYKKVYEVLGDINSRLRKNDPLSMDEALMQSAMQRAAELSILYNNDVRPNMEDALAIQSKADASDILFGFADTEKAYNAFYSSTRARANMINTEYKSVGIGSFSTGGNYYWAILFSKTDSAGVSVHEDVNKAVTIQLVENGIGVLKTGIAGQEVGAVSMYVGKSVEVTPLWSDRSSGLPNDNVRVTIEDNSFAWTTSDASVVRVSDKGIIKAKGVGEAVVTAVPRIGKGSGLSIKVTVKKNTITSSLKSDTYIWTGQKIMPEVTVKKGSKILKAGQDYTVKYKKNKKVGYGRVIVNGKGDYEDQTETLLFKIMPAQMKISAKAWKTKLKLTWPKSSQATGYEIKIATSKNMKEDLILEELPNTKTSIKLKKLPRETTYYVRIRQYTTIVSGEKMYSKWSKRLKVATK